MSVDGININPSVHVGRKITSIHFLFLKLVELGYCHLVLPSDREVKTFACCDFQSSVWLLRYDSQQCSHEAVWSVIKSMNDLPMFI